MTTATPLPPQRPGDAVAYQLRPAQATAEAALRDAGLSGLAASLLSRRGIADADAARRIVQPSLLDLPDPHLLADAELAADRLARAVQRGERICIYGDYDVDGVTAAALLHTFLQAAGATVQVFLPDRLRDGYGLHKDRLAELCDAGVQLFVSVDCGATAVAEIELVRQRGVDFIVVDHHALGTELPPATALLNPRRSDCQYPDKGLAAVGVALVLAQATRRALARLGQAGAQQLPMRALLEFAALGTLADLVPLVGVNRILTWHGLRSLGQSQRAGVQALASRGNTELAGLSGERVGFALAPRINAAGRVADARTAFTLLTTTSSQEAAALAERIERDNDERKALQQAAAEQALLLAAGQSHAVLVQGPWHPGVVGIVASRVVEQTGLPALVLAEGDDGLLRGSGRSVPGYDLLEGLRAVSDGLVERLGGHAFACGLTVRSEHVTALHQRWQAQVAEAIPPGSRKTVRLIDLELGCSELSAEWLAEQDALEPFGKGFEQPRLLLRRVELADLRQVGKSGSWAQGKLAEPGRQPLWARHKVAFFAAADALGDARNGDVVDAVVQVSRNVWRGQVNLQARIEALLPADARVPYATAGA